jgi:UDP-N-acetyl-D-galactosamine dehydrogenase
MYGIELLAEPAHSCYAAVVLAVAHNTFRQKAADWVRELLSPKGVVFDVKGILPRIDVDDRL